MSDNGRFGEGLRAFLRRSDMGFAIMRHDIRLGLIHATRAYVPGHDAIVANFLSPGSHWQTVADLIHDAEQTLTAEHDREHTAEAAPGRSGWRRLPPSRSSQPYATSNGCQITYRRNSEPPASKPADGFALNGKWPMTDP